LIETLSLILVGLIGLILAGMILVNPFLGIVLIAASLPVTDLLPTIPMVSSIFPIVGGVTIFGYLIKNINKRGNGVKSTHPILILGLLFIIWMFITNPQAAWSGTDRNWIFTYGQLLILTFLAEELLEDPDKYKTFLWVFSIVAMISATVAIQQGSIGEDIDTSIRTGGLSEGANSAGRYFVVAMIFFVYLRTIEKKPILRTLSGIGIIITFLGVFFTVSRTSIVLLFTAIGLIILLNPQKKLNFSLIIVFMLAILTLTMLSESVFKIIASIIPSISQGTDTIGLRYKLWDAGFRMWLDHPITGVGIGRFPYELPYYARGIPPHYLHLVAHSTYVQLLSETGIVGLALWLSMAAVSLVNLWRASQTEDLELKSLARMWFIVLLVLLIGGITMTQSAEKLIWICMGVSEYFHLRALNQPEKEKTKTLNLGAAVKPG
jgi:O-antigen ligase